MLLDLINYLYDNFSHTITNLSQTGGSEYCEDRGGNEFIKNDFKMIDMDYIACKFPDDRTLSSVDGLYVKEDNDKLKFYLVEFKKMKFDDLDNLNISLKYFKMTVEECNKNSACFCNAYKSCKNYLADKTQVNLEIKPLNTLMLLRKLYIQYKAYRELNSDEPFRIEKEYTNNYSLDFQTIEDFSNITYLYYVVYEFEELSYNYSNNQEQNSEYFYFLEKLKPYPFSVARSLNDNDFVYEILREMKG